MRLDPILWTVQGQQYQLTCNVLKACNIEEALSISIVNLCGRLLEGKITISQLAAIVGICAEPAMDVNEIYAGINESGVGVIFDYVAGMLLRLLQPQMARTEIDMQQQLAHIMQAYPD